MGSEDSLFQNRSGQVCHAEILLIRHGEALGAEEGRYIGVSDPALSARGEQQGRRIAMRLSSVGVQRVVSSDKRRALTTAAIIARAHGLAPEVRSELGELNFGAWEGARFEELLLHDGVRFRLWLAQPWRYGPPGGESLASLWRRARVLWEDLRAAQEGSVTVVVGHGGSLRALLGIALGVSPKALLSWELIPGSISCLGVTEGRAWLRYVNDACHL